MIGACKYYAALATDDYVKINKEAKGGYWETSRAVYPAAKEQRDKLEKAMADAGYAFDFDNKELKEIENEEYDGGEPPYGGKQWLDLGCLEYKIPKDKFKDGDSMEVIIRKIRK